MTDNDGSVYNELIEFLKSEREDLRAAACEAAFGVTDREGMEKLIKYGAVKPLCRLISSPGKTGENALQTLINLCSTPPSAEQCVEDCIDGGAIERASEIALSFESGKNSDKASHVNNALSLLVNITRNERGTVQILGRSSFSEGEGASNGGSKPIMSLLFSRFLVNDSNGEDESGVSYAYQRVAALLMNITQTESGRKFMTKTSFSSDSVKDEEETESTSNKTTVSLSRLQCVLPQLRSSNRVRRHGTAGAIKNCCFDRDSSWWLLNVVGVVKHILYPLAGPEDLDVDEKTGMDPELWLEGPDKVREPDADIRLLLVESLLLLCASGRRSREFLRKERVYVIVKLADMVEENEELGEKFNDCVQFLRRDEEGCQEGSSDRMVDDACRLSLPPSAPPSVNTEDYDDVD